MTGGVKRTYRLVAASFALAGIAFYALLLPWHFTSQLERQLFEAEFGAASAVMCGTANDPAAPGAPSSNCPICKGLAAFQLAIAPAAALLAPPALRATSLDLPVADHVAGASLPTPRSRGPPLSA